MRFGLLQEGHTPPGVTPAQRYHEMADEVVLAEASGFDFYCLPEQHFMERVATVSAPEVLFANFAARTSRIRFRFTSAVMLAFNHPVRTAERVAALDILSNGRVDVGTARSNNLHSLQAFGVDPSSTRAQWEDSVALLLKALSSDGRPFSHEGPLWSFPERLLVPPPVQKPHPPVFVSATSVPTHHRAGELGLGVMNGNNILGWEYLEECMQAYRDGIASARAAGVERVHDSLGVSVLTAHCAEDPEQAMREAADSAFLFIDIVVGMYGNLSQASPDYAYLGRIKEIGERKRDLEYLVGLAPYISIGTPEFLIDRFRRVRDMGADEVLLRIDGMGHEANMRGIEMIGKHVIPALKETAATRSDA